MKLRLKPEDELEFRRKIETIKVVMEDIHVGKFVIRDFFDGMT